MRQFLFSLCIALIVFGLTLVVLQNDIVAILLAVIALFLSFFWLCLLAMAHYSEELTYSDKRTWKDKRPKYSYRDSV